jgi:hypothetical protein
MFCYVPTRKNLKKGDKRFAVYLFLIGYFERSTADPLLSTNRVRDNTCLEFYLKNKKTKIIRVGEEVDPDPKNSRVKIY